MASFIKSVILSLLVFFIFPVILTAQSASGNALSTDGIDDFAYPLTPNAAGFTEGTIELWFSSDAWSNSQQLWAGGVGLPGTNGDFVRFGTHISVPNNNLAFGIYAGNWQWAHAQTQPDEGVWYHTAATWGPNGIKTYLNGILKETNSHNGALDNYATELVAATSWTEYYAGKIDELRIWNFAKDSSAILRTMNDTLGAEYYSTSDSGLVAYYRMDIFEDLGINGDGMDDLRDLSVNANHLDAQGNPALISSGAFNLTTSVYSSNESQRKYTLNQNYPNPFNPSTTFSFQLNNAALVDLSIFDLQGQKVANIVNKKLGSGSHQYNWDASGHASGIYYFRMTTEQETITKKCMLLK